MHVKILAYKVKDDNTYLKVDGNIQHMFERCQASLGEIRIDDGRLISHDQRKKAYATIKDIAEWMGEIPEYVKEVLKFDYQMDTGEEYFSLSDCTMSTARDFITFLLEFALYHGVPLLESGIDRCDDIGKYLWNCLHYKKCCICGKQGEIHHWDRIGMGNDRKKIDDSEHRKMCLCREHHTISHNMGNVEFEKKYKVYGVLYEGKD